jgi:Zn-dependent M28 family amino/carboxypeptidase
MLVKHSSNSRSLPINIDFQKHLCSINENELINIVDEISIPRHFKFNAKNNKYVAEWIFSQLSSFGYETHFQGSYSNIVASNPNIKSSSAILIGAHYDSVPNCPGADDNASAIASLIVCAKAVSQFAPDVPICFVAFNCEEDGLIGSQDFVSSYLSEKKLKINQVHILEMLGYATDKPDTQSLPSGLPIKIPTVGNFIGIMGNRDSLDTVDKILSLGKTYLPELSVVGLKLYFGAEKLIPDLGRSDHLPFWEKRIPSVMWTDTAEFRNPNYHQFSDMPDTLNYPFLKKATQLLFLQILNSTTLSKQE